MDNTGELELRIENAMQRLKSQATRAAALGQKLSDLQEQRKKDVAELDTLVAELKPLVGED